MDRTQSATYILNSRTGIKDLLNFVLRRVKWCRGVPRPGFTVFGASVHNYFSSNDPHHDMSGGGCQVSDGLHNWHCLHTFAIRSLALTLIRNMCRSHGMDDNQDHEIDPHSD